MKKDNYIEFKNLKVENKSALLAALVLLLLVIVAFVVISLLGAVGLIVLLLLIPVTAIYDLGRLLVYIFRK